MKLFNYILIIIFSFSNFECGNTYVPDSNDFTRIKSETLKEQIIELIPMLKRDERHPNDISIRVLISKNNIYLDVLAMDCDVGEYYKFYEGFNSEFIPVYIDKKSYKPERFFDLKDLSVISNKFEDTDYYCDDYFFVQSRIKAQKNNFIIEKIITSENYDPKDRIFTEEDIKFLNGMVRVVIPEPEEKLPEEK